MMNIKGEIKEKNFINYEEIYLIIFIIVLSNYKYIIKHTWSIEHDECMLLLLH